MKIKRKKKTSTIERKKKRDRQNPRQMVKQHKQQSTDKNKQRSFHTHKENIKKKRIIRFICNIKAKKSNVTVKKQQLEIRNPVKIEAVHSFVYS